MPAKVKKCTTPSVEQAASSSARNVESPMSSALVPSHYDELRGKYGMTMRTADVADVLHMHPSHVRAMCQKGELPAVRAGSRWIIPTVKFAAMLDGAGCDGE